jgi:plastocyanin
MRTRLIAVALLVLAGAACGDDDDDDSADATTATVAATTTAAVAATTTAAAAGGTQPAGEPTIVISGFKFPEETTVAAGEPITVRNDDGATHTFTNVDGAFSVEVPSGETVTVDPLEPGTYEYVCNFHGGMHGTLVVE